MRWHRVFLDDEELRYFCLEFLVVFLERIFGNILSQTKKNKFEQKKGSDNTDHLFTTAS